MAGRPDGLDDLDPHRQACSTMAGDGSHGQSSRGKLVDDGTADRAEPGDDVQIRLSRGCHWGILGLGLVG